MRLMHSTCTIMYITHAYHVFCTDHESWNIADIVWLSYQITKYRLISCGSRKKYRWGVIRDQHDHHHRRYHGDNRHQFRRLASRSCLSGRTRWSGALSWQEISLSYIFRLASTKILPINKVKNIFLGGWQELPTSSHPVNSFYAKCWNYQWDLIFTCAARWKVLPSQVPSKSC